MTRGVLQTGEGGAWMMSVLAMVVKCPWVMGGTPRAIFPCLLCSKAWHRGPHPDGCRLDGSHLSLVLLVTVALGQSFMGQPGSSLASEARLMTICSKRLPNYLNPSPSLQVSTERTGLRKGRMPPLCSSACPTELDGGRSQGNDLFTWYRSA